VWLQGPGFVGPERLAQTEVRQNAADYNSYGTKRKERMPVKVSFSRIAVRGRVGGYRYTTIMADKVNRDIRFWALMGVFQVLFGLTVFALTRDYYLHEASTVASTPVAADPSAPLWPQELTADDISRMTSPATAMPASKDPAEIYRQAEEAFANRQYDTAARFYEQLLAFSPNDAEIRNNLGLTLFYTGRVDDALRALNNGVAVDPEHQRTWLTLGYVNSQLGNTAEARAALDNAVRLGTDEAIRESARKMLAELPE
jgi:GNAT superfamily N-acetyltransferase